MYTSQQKNHEGDQLEFFELLNTKLDDFERMYIIIGGDFNINLNELDKSSNYKLKLINSKSRNKLLELMEMHDLIDI